MKPDWRVLNLWTLRTFVFLLACVPFIDPRHYEPSGEFGISVLAMMLAAPIIILGLLRTRHWQAPIWSFVFLILAIVALWQGHMYEKYQYAMAVLVAFLLAGQISALSNDEKEQIIISLALGLIAGSLINIIAVFLQKNGMAPYGEGLVFYNRANIFMVFGQLGQRNLLSNYLLLGVLSVGYLWQTGRCKIWLALILAALYGLALVWADSRMTLLVLAGFVLAGIYVLNRSASLKKMGIFLLFVVAVYFVWQVCNHLWFVFYPNPVLLGENALGRIQLGGYSSRLEGFRSAATLIFTHPLLGLGVGNIARGHFDAFASGILPPFFEETLLGNAHNIFLQLALECGIPLLIFMVVIFIYSLWGCWAKGEKNSVLFALLMLWVVMAHGMVEFPLWNVNFLMVFVVFLSTLQSRSLILSANPFVCKMVAIPFLALTLFVLPMSYRAYFYLADLMPSEVKPGLSMDEAQNIDRYSRYPWLRYMADVTSITFLDASNPKQLEFIGQRVGLLVSYAPSPMLLCLEIDYLRHHDAEKKAAEIFSVIEKVYPKNAKVAPDYCRVPN